MRSRFWGQAMSGLPDLAGKVAVVTGGASGIGKGIAAALAAEGAQVVIADIQRDAMEAAAAEIGAAAVLTDVSAPASVDALAAAVLDRYGAVHVVCNNAGIGPLAPVADLTLDDWRWMLGVNLWGVIHGVHTFLPILKQNRDGGHIVNTASMAGLVGMQWLGVYCAAKFAVVGLTESLHRELKPQGIGVSVLCPMIVQTDINRNSVRNRPQALRNPGDPVDFEEPGADVQGLMKGGVIAVDEVARRVVRAIDRGDLYVLTHPEQREFLRRRAAKLDAMFEPGQW